MKSVKIVGVTIAQKFQLISFACTRHQRVAYKMNLKHKCQALDEIIILDPNYGLPNVFGVVGAQQSI